MSINKSDRDYSPIRIMIAADDPSQAQAAAIRFQNYNPDWDIADISLSGRETIEKAKVIHPDIIIMDLNIRGISGFDVIKLVHESDPQVHFIVIAKTKELDSIQTALRLQVSDYFISPFNQDVLISSIERVAGVVSGEKQIAREHENLEKRMETAMRMIRKDYISMLVKSDSTQLRKLMTYANFLGVEDQPGFMIAISEMKKKPTFQMPETIIYRLSTEYNLIGKSIQPGLSIAFLSCPEDGESFRRSVMASLDALLVNYKKEGENIIGSAGSIDVGALQMKTSLLEALSALNYQGSVPSPYKQCIIYDAEKMSLPKSHETPAPSSSPVSTEGTVMEQVITYIEQNYQHDLPLKEAAEAAGLSPYYFCHLFKKYTGKTFSDFLLQFRINKAKELLADRSYTVKKVAYLVGFNDPNYFSKIFHRETGIKANEYAGKK